MVMRSILLSLTLAAVLLGGCADGAPSSSEQQLPVNEPEAISSTPQAVAAESDVEPGFHLVGDEIEAGRWVLYGADGTCAYSRISRAAMDGESDEEPHGSGVAFGRTVVDLTDDDDEIFQTDCGGWVPLVEQENLTIVDGDWLVGSELDPGKWRALEASATCYWEVGAGFGHGPDEILASGHSSGQALANIPEDAERFTSFNCGEWTLDGE